VRTREVLAVGALLLEQVGHGVQPEAVDADVEPEPQGLDDGFLHPGVLVVQVGLVAEEAVPEVLLAHRVERPVRRLGVHEDDAGVLVALVGVGPDVEVAEGAVRVAAEAWNQGCWSDVWFMTKSMITRMPSLWASSTNSEKSPIVPNSGSTSVKSDTS
jgi:hypothetical protein